MMKLQKSVLFGAAASLLAVGCTAEIGGKNPGATATGGNPTTTPDPGTMIPPIVTSESAPVAAPMRRLTRLEYDNTIRDLLGEPTQVAQGFAGELDRYSTGFGVGGPVATVDARQLMEASETLGAAFVKNASTVLGCGALPTTSSEEDACAAQFIHSFSLRAFRRPALPEEEKALIDYFHKGRVELGESFVDAARLVVQVILQSPSFLYRWELGPQAPKLVGDGIAFSNWEIASRLSYGLWASMPDKTLFDAAAAGQLSTPDQVQGQTRRMLADPKALDMFVDFAEHWLGLADLLRVEKDAAVYPGFSNAVAQSMVTEERTFVKSLFGTQGDGKLTTLLTSTQSFADQNLSAVYGTTPMVGSTPGQFDASQRAGILTQAAFLTAHGAPGGSHPIQRGKWILEKVLCEELPIPPPNVPMLPAPLQGVSTRERFAAHSAAACAKGCHDKMDPLGFAFEHYDGMGAYRAADAGKPVNSSGSLELDGATVSFQDAPGLAKLLAQSKTVQGCVVKQLTRYVLRRREAAGDTASLRDSDAAFAASQFDIREALFGLTGSQSFFYRKPSIGEVTQ